MALGEEFAPCLLRALPGDTLQLIQRLRGFHRRGGCCQLWPRAGLPPAAIARGSDRVRSCILESGCRLQHSDDSRRGRPAVAPSCPGALCPS